MYIGRNTTCYIKWTLCWRERGRRKELWGGERGGFCKVEGVSSKRSKVYPRMTPENIV